jgi:hypothetical protein
VASVGVASLVQAVTQALGLDSPISLSVWDEDFAEWTPLVDRAEGSSLGGDDHAFDDTFENLLISQGVKKIKVTVGVEEGTPPRL